MRPRIRPTKATSRRVLSERARLTVRRTVSALRRSREALVDLDGQLGEILIRLRTGGVPLDRGTSARLASAKSEAMAAVCDLGQAGQLFA
ncbi:MAG: hypothetical protein JXP73_03820 [Deltaproteobacteria bacterium]|nr:hypothetical protein [Deltaproteobacteria bacterium]